MKTTNRKILPGVFKGTTRLQKRGGRRGYRSFDEARSADMCMQMRFSREIKRSRERQERREQHEANLKAKQYRITPMVVRPAAEVEEEYGLPSGSLTPEGDE